MSQVEKRVELNKIIESQLPEFLVADFPKAVDFFKQYYISQEYQGGPVDIAENLDQYLKLDNLLITAIDKHYWEYLHLFLKNTELIIHDPTDSKAST